MTAPPVQQPAVISGQQTPAQRQQTPQKLGMTVQQPGASIGLGGGRVARSEPLGLALRQIGVRWVHTVGVDPGVDADMALVLLSGADQCRL